jgi:hypothetical protein
MYLSRGVWIGLFAVLSTLAEDQKVPPPQASEMDRAIQEFKVQTAQMGVRSDSPVSARTRSAARQPWHGRLFENLRNDLLDAVPHEIAQRGESKSLLRRNQFGFNVTGPVMIPWLLKPRSSTYFSLSYEGVRERISRTTLTTIPTLGERAGDFSSTVDQSGDQLPIFDPATTRENSSFNPSQAVSTENLQYLRDAFPQNRIPVSRLDRTALAAASLYPAPNASAGPFFQNNYFINSPETNVANGVIGKVDHTISDRNRLSFEFNYSNGLLGASRWFDNVGNPGPPDTQSSTRRGSIQWDFTASPQVVNSFSIDASSESYDTGSAANTFPVYGFAEYLGLGRGSQYTVNVRNNFAFADAISIRKGKHSLRLAAQTTLQQVKSYWPRYPDGSFSFSTGLTSLPGIVNTGHSFASFLLGLPGYAERSITTSPSYFSRTATSFTIRDSYELRKNLTVAVAANVIVRTPRVEKYNRQSTIDLNAINPANDLPGALVAAGVNGISRGFRPVVLRLDPSASLSWTPESAGKITVRAAYSLSHGPIPIYFGQSGTQGFNGYQTFISPNVQLEPAVLLSSPLPGLAYPLPDLRPDAANDTVADLLDMTDRDPVYFSGSLSLERELPGSVVISAGGSFSGGHNLLVGDSAANPNAIPLDALKYRDQLNNEDFNASLRPYPQYKGFEVHSLYPRSHYNRTAGHLRVEKRISMGLALNAYYEMSKQLDDYSGPYGTQDYYNQRNEWSLTSYNRPRYLQLSYTYELPIGPNKPLLNYQDWRRHLASGWSLSGSGLYASGVPLAMHPAFNNTGGVVSALRVNVVPGVSPTVANPGPDLWFNPAAFDQPADFTVGNAPRTQPNLFGPPSQNWDLSVTKRIPLDADRVMEFSAAAFNFINHANWNPPDVTIGSASAPNVNAGKIIGSHGGRVIQLGLRFSF